MPKPIQSEPRLSLDRRQLLTSAAVVAATGVVPSYAQVKAATPSEVVTLAEKPDLECVCCHGSQDYRNRKT
jgi:hypothetical protein